MQRRYGRSQDAKLLVRANFSYLLLFIEQIVAMEVGPGGKQIQLEDPDGNPIELFQPAH